MKSYLDEHLDWADRISDTIGWDQSEPTIEYRPSHCHLRSADQFQGRRLAAKRRSKASDSPKAVRTAQVTNTAGNTDHERMGEDGVWESPDSVDARLGANVTAKIHRNPTARDRVLANTRAELHF